ncbi:MAG: hypothetical protein FWD68_19845 [Alphaproteobacteria bacterium]|nr:hypothetical protein [Alphaproteobacteria bacterium]
MTSTGFARRRPDTDFRVGSVLRQAFAVLASGTGIRLTLFAFLLYALAPLAVQIMEWTGRKPPSWSIPATGIYGIVIFIFTLTMALSGAGQHLCEGRFVFTACLRHTTRRAPALLVTFLLASLLVSLPFIVTGTLLDFATRADLPLFSGNLLTLHAITAFLAFLIAVRVAISTTICVIEKAGPISSIRRSFRLTKTQLWKVHAVVLAALLLFFAAPLSDLLIWFGPRLARSIPVHRTVLAWGSQFLRTTAFTLTPIITTALLLNLRRSAELPPNEELVRVFE